MTSFATLSVCDGDSDLLSNVRQLVLIGVTSPIGSCEAERSLCALRCIKSHMRASMGQNRLAGLTMMASHSSLAQQLDTQDIQANSRRLFCQSIIAGIHITEIHL